MIQTAATKAQAKIAIHDKSDSQTVSPPHGHATATDHHHGWVEIMAPDVPQGGAVPSSFSTLLATSIAVHTGAQSRLL
jgi:hypothetical protein